jgi:tyrosyl-tRNA synthetase
MAKTNSKKIDEILERGTIVEIIPSKKEFREELLKGKKLRMYIGFDATAPTLHLSHAKNIMLMEKFRQLGHEIVILFGDFTARIGDPSGESSKRKQLTKEEVLSNVKKWKKLIKPLMNFNDKKNPPKVLYNSKWLAKLNFEEIINLASNFTVQRMLERDMFEKRMKEEKPIYLHEFFYPLMQGYDSVFMDVDVEVCGRDQIFNALAGRTLLKKLKNKEKFVVANTLMENPKTGELMSKSKGTGIFIDAKPNDMFGQIMAQPDEMIEILFINNTLLSKEEIKEILKKEPRESKMILSFEIVKIFYGEKLAQKAKDNFIISYVKKEIPKEISLTSLKFKNLPLFKILPDISPEMIKSNSMARQIIEQGGVDIEYQTIKNPYFILEKNKEYIIKIGKKIFKKIILN